MLRLRFRSSYIGGKERVRNLLQDAPESDSVAARGAELWPFEGTEVPEHDLALILRGKRARNLLQDAPENDSVAARRAEL